MNRSMRRMRELVVGVFFMFAFIVAFWSLFFGSLKIALLSGVIMAGLLFWLYIEDLMRIQTFRRKMNKNRK